MGIWISGVDAQRAAAVDEAVVAEMVRLESIFNVFDPTSELSRWKRDEVDAPSDEFCELMAVALRWQVRGGGRFNPMAGVLSAMWRRAQADGVTPDPGELSELASSIVEPRFRIDAGRPVRRGDCTLLDVNAIAKGYIVDRALDVVEDDEVGLVVNAGGDVAHRGPESFDVGVENPLRPYDNEPPLTTVVLSGTAVATSGGARRGFRVGARRYSHVIDPRSGWPVEHSASITVCASDATTADVAATVLGVPEPGIATAEAAELGVSCLCVLADGHVATSPGWPYPAELRRA